ncbi:MAG: zf-HC2 domain-containing protein [Gemmatimonadota bacterium]|nr:zf-HC2 domain-containing protein [Gemmatimonadota bacterium]MDE3004537.1 zf-HC2 domain-containing protein [Gemmatimonadota bacterium]MDE3012668.1 zf-HC2 domain-containing protein [Gemmatimonadota bacterium]
MTHDHTISHLSAQTLQAFLDGDLSRREASAAEAHLAACARCAAELDGWRVLYENLGGLSSHRPHAGFHDRVMAQVDVPESVSLGAGVLGRIEEFTVNAHVAPDVLQDFIEGSLAAQRAERVKAHLAACADCAQEADAWLGVMRRLDELPSFTPGEGFADRVVTEIRLPETPSLVARLRARVAGLAGRTPEHVPMGLLQDLVDGTLPQGAVARIDAHVADCIVCTRELKAWRSVSAQLNGLERLAPSEHFRDRVMEALAASHAKKAIEPQRPWSRAAAWAWRLVPQTRQTLAALAGIAVTPMVIVGLIAYAVFSHPTLTIGSLLAFTWWQVFDAVTGAVTTLSTAALENAGSLGAESLFEMFAAAPLLVAGGVIVYTIASAFAVRLLWKTLYGNASSAT